MKYSLFGALLSATLVLSGCSYVGHLLGVPFPSSTTAPSFAVQGSGLMKKMTLSTTTVGANIYYTVDGSTPTIGSTHYTSPFLVGGQVGMSVSIHAIATRLDLSDSPVSSTRVFIGPIAPLSLSTVVTTLAGSPSAGSANGTGSAASFNDPYGVSIDGGDLYVADAYNNEIRKVAIATGVVTVFAGSPVAGSADGTGTAAGFNTPVGIATDGTNLYVTDSGNNEIRKIVIATGVVSTLAGSPVAGSADGTGTAAGFNTPGGITTDGTDLYVTDSGNNEIRKIVIATGVVSTLAGSLVAGSANGTGTAAGFNTPVGITTDGTDLYVTDSGNNEIRKIVIATGAVSTLAGSMTAGSADGIGSAAGFSYPAGITTDGAYLYVADVVNNEIRRIAIATGAVTTLAGSITISTPVDGTGTAAGFDQPAGIATDGRILYVADSLSNEVREMR